MAARAPTLLEPGGVLYVSLHMESLWSRMGPNIPLYVGLIRRASELREGPVTPETFKSPMPGDRVAFTFPGRSLYNCNVFHSTAYVQEVWGRFFRVLEIIPDGISPHDCAVLQKV